MELYSETENESLEGSVLHFDDDLGLSSQKKELSGTLDGHYKVINSGGSYIKNTEGDTVILKGVENDVFGYGDEGSVGVPGERKSIGRSPDGSDNLIVFDESSQGKPNLTPPTATPLLTLPPTSTPTTQPTPTPVPDPTLTPTPPLKSATYKINKVVDRNGDPISRVRIYVDGVYIRHDDEETLTFCDDCYCDDYKEVLCSFGEHAIRLEKNGYLDWTETRTLSAGNSYEVHPQMYSSEPTIAPKPTSTPTKKPTSTPTPTKKLTPTLSPTVGPTLTATESGELENLLATPTGEILGETKEAGNSGQRNGAAKNKVIAGLSIGAGGILITAAGIWGKKKDKNNSGKMKNHEE